VILLKKKETIGKKTTLKRVSLCLEIKKRGKKKETNVIYIFCELSTTKNRARKIRRGGKRKDFLGLDNGECDVYVFC